MSAGDYANGRPAGFINSNHLRSRVQRMKWTADNDRKLLLVGLGREISPKEYAAIASLFPEQPTTKSVQERLTKLRQEQMGVLRQLGIVGPTAPIHEAPGSASATSSPASSSLVAESALTNPSTVSTMSPLPAPMRPADLWVEQPKISRKRSHNVAGLDEDVAMAVQGWANRENVAQEQLVPLNILAEAAEQLDGKGKGKVTFEKAKEAAKKRKSPVLPSESPVETPNTLPSSKTEVAATKDSYFHTRLIPKRDHIQDVVGEMPSSPEDDSDEDGN